MFQKISNNNNVNDNGNSNGNDDEHKPTAIATYLWQWAENKKYVSIWYVIYPLKKIQLVLQTSFANVTLSKKVKYAITSLYLKYNFYFGLKMELIG